MNGIYPADGHCSPSPVAFQIAFIQRTSNRSRFYIKFTISDI